MISDMSHLSGRSCMIDRYHVCKIALIDLYIDVECPTECSDLHIVTIGTSPSHLSQVAFENSSYFFRGWPRGIEGGREGTSVLSLRVSAKPTPRMNIDELFVESGMLTHIHDRR